MVILEIVITNKEFFKNEIDELGCEALLNELTNKFSTTTES